MISNNKDSYANFEKAFPYLMEIIDDLIIIASSDNSFKIEQLFEGKFLDQLGYSKKNLVGKSLLKFIHFGDGISEKYFIELMNQEKSEQNIQIIRNNSKIIWTELRSRRFSDEKNRQKVIIKLRNISKMNALETKIKESEKLEESEEKYRLLYENTTDLISVFNENFEYMYVNEPNHYKILGYSNEELIAIHPLSIIHPDDRKPTALNVSRILRKGEGSFQVRIKHKDGSYKWLEMSAKSFIDSRGNKNIVSIGRDLTDHKRIEEKIRESQEKYRLVIENANDLIRVLNERFEFEYINEKVHQKILGYSKDDLIGKLQIPLYHPEDRKRAIRAFNRILKKGYGSY